MLQIKHIAKTGPPIARFCVRIDNYVCVATLRFAYVTYNLSGVQLELYNPGLVQKKHIFFFLDANCSRLDLQPLDAKQQKSIEAEVSSKLGKIVKKKIKGNLDNIFEPEAEFIMHPIESIIPSDQMQKINELFKNL